MDMTNTDSHYGEFYNGDADARRLQVTGLVTYGLLYGHVLFCVLGMLPPWTLVLSAPVLIVRWMIATHELFHLSTQDQVDPVTRLMPLMLTPLSLGYKEFLTIHRGHHQHMATPEDPEYFQINGSPAWGFLNALTAPEQAFFRWLDRERPDAELMLGATLRCALFVGLVWASGPVFLWYWLPTRLAFGMAYFVFFYVEHRRGEAYAVYPMPLPPWLRALFGFVFGQEAMLATTHHDMHHRYPRVSAFHLPTVARQEAG
jgi:fatty acid desaturase